jgi:oxygen-dependent protoporphyrinogen oxidase
MNQTAPAPHHRVVIVGAGITGLTAAFYLRRSGAAAADTIVLEAAGAPGGNIETLSEDGFRVEHGPNGFLDNVPETLQLARDLGLTPLRSSDAARKRFLACRDGLVRVPEGPVSFLRSPLLSLRGRLRVFAEPFGPGPPPGDETVFSFASRRIGPEAAAVLVDAMVTGVFAGDSTVLSLKSAFPKMAAMEARYGSLIRALLAKMWKRLRKDEESAPGGPAGPGGVLTSFPGGLAELVGALRTAVGDALRCGERVREVTRRDGRFLLSTGQGSYTADRVLLAVPAARSAAILDRSCPAAANILRQIPAAPLAVVACAFDRRAFPHSLDGFGFLVPRRERSRLLGSLWTSSIFPGRAPSGKVLLRSMIGGARDLLAVELPDETLTAIVLGELRRFMGPLPAPERVWIFRYPEGISQYPPGHEDRLSAVEVALRTMPGLVLAGNSFRGISVNLCVVQARQAAARLAEKIG